MDLICSPIGTEFYVLYNPIDKYKYKSLYCNEPCKRNESFFDEFTPFCYCDNCDHIANIKKSEMDADTRANILNSTGYFEIIDISDFCLPTDYEYPKI